MLHLRRSVSCNVQMINRQIILAGRPHKVCTAYAGRDVHTTRIGSCVCLIRHHSSSAAWRIAVYVRIGETLQIKFLSSRVHKNRLQKGGLLVKFQFLTIIFWRNPKLKYFATKSTVSHEWLRDKSPHLQVRYFPWWSLTKPVLNS